MSAAFVCYKETLTVYIQGELDHHSAKEIRTRIDAEITRRNPENVVLDFSKVTFMDSSGIGLVMGRYKIMSERGGRVIVQNPTPPIKKVMQISGIGRLAKIVNQRDRLFDVEQESKTEKEKEVASDEAVEKEHDKPDDGTVSGSVPE